MAPRNLLAFILFVICSYAHGTEAFPLWDNVEPVSEYAKRVNLPPTQTLDLGNGVKLELVLIPAGKFKMGTPEHEKPWVGQLLLGVSASLILIALVVVLIRARKRKQRPQVTLAAMLVLTLVSSVGVWGGVRWNEALKHLGDSPNEHPAHGVNLTKPFYLGKFTVTQEQYQAVMGSNPSNFKGKDNPVETVSWDDAQEFCKRLSDLTKHTTRLPTEAEWEYSCRAGTTTTYYSGDTEADLARVAWYYGNSKSTMNPVGQKEPNKFGLYDMHGNVWQWCQDWYGEDYYGKSDTENPAGPAQGAYRSLRGGSWYFDTLHCRSAARFRDGPDSRNLNIGFRVGLVPSFRTP